MSSRSKDSERLATLAEQIADVSAGCVKMVGVLASLNESFSNLESQVTEIDECLNDLEHRLIRLERG